MKILWAFNRPRDVNYHGAERVEKRIETIVSIFAFHRECRGRQGLERCQLRAHEHQRSHARRCASHACRDRRRIAAALDGAA
ncbi:hypothetical protein QZM22_08655 [Burkholderia oklahomensis]|uniref:hypothetical protein n=1 Tax=Burkholderia oklahomensis TaxID=342113 RepID=UPI002652B955|nr:hypothetical protein [Burkholderia oklahomensis]MDN7672582.1 hypothetical protein [Burkholderia oklahomensis]